MTMTKDLSAQAAAVLAEMKSKGAEKTRITYARHGHGLERTLGVSVADMKLIAKKLKGEQDTAYELYDTGLMEPMYLAGMVADGSKMTEAQLHAWAKGADGLSMISDYTVPWVTVEHAKGRELAAAWIGSTGEFLVASGWRTYSGLVTTVPDERLDLAEIEALLSMIVASIHTAQNRVKLTMNSFVIAVGSYVQPLSARARAAAHKIGAVSADMGDTACEVPLAIAYIEKAEATGKLGKKRKTIRC
jgi:3-methyladenine DNA glycosylase AlkD